MKQNLTMASRIILASVLLCVVSSVFARQKTTDKNNLHNLQEISQQFAQALNNKNEQLFHNIVDKEALVSEVLKDVNLSEKDYQDLAKGIKIGLNNLPKILAARIGNEGQVTYLKLIKRSGKTRGLVRVDFTGGGINYMELFARTTKNGKFKIYDYYDHIMGQRYTETVRQILTSIIPKENNAFTRMIERVSQAGRDQRNFAKVILATRQGKHQEALNKFEQLSKEFQVQRTPLLMRVQIAQEINDAKYRESLELLSKHHGDDPSLGLILVDHYYYTKRYNKAYDAIDRFNAFVKGDVALDNLKVNLLVDEKKYSKAVQVAKAAIIRDDSYEDLYWSLVSIYVITQQYKNVVNGLTSLEQKFGYHFDPNVFAKEEFYRDFSQSKAFKVWKKGRHN